MEFAAGEGRNAMAADKMFPSIAPNDGENADAKTKASVAATNADLSEEIARTMPRSKGEQVTCRRVAQNHYRCNWWAQENKGAYDNPSMSGLLVTTSKICKSRFLRVTKTAAGLQITGNN
jgi:hypothetical protein